MGHDHTGERTFAFFGLVKPAASGDAIGVEFNISTHIFFPRVLLVSSRLVGCIICAAPVRWQGSDHTVSVIASSRSLARWIFVPLALAVVGNAANVKIRRGSL